MYLAAAAGLPAAAAQDRPVAADADALYRQRADLTRAREAVAIWDQRLRADGRDFEATWKLARARYWIGTHEDDDEGRETLELGMRSAERALAESGGVMSGLRYRGRIKDALERVLAIDQAGSRARPTARSAAGTSKCRACSADRTPKPKNTSGSRSPTTRTAPHHWCSSPRS